MFFHLFVDVFLFELQSQSGKLISVTNMRTKEMCTSLVNIVSVCLFYAIAQKFGYKEMQDTKLNSTKNVEKLKV